jgi:hypothetical protein
LDGPLLDDLDMDMDQILASPNNYKDLFDEINKPSAHKKEEMVTPSPKPTKD